MCGFLSDGGVVVNTILGHFDLDMTSGLISRYFFTCLEHISYITANFESLKFVLC